MTFNTIDLYNGVQVLEASGDGVQREESENPQATVKYIVRNASGINQAYGALIQYLKNECHSEEITAFALPLSNVKINTTDSDRIYLAECTYSFKESSGNNSINNDGWEQPQIDDLDFAYSTVGGTTHITRGYETLYQVNRKFLGDDNGEGAQLNDYHNGINWDGENFQGCDVVTPKTSFTITVNWPKNVFTADVRRMLSLATGSINNAVWYGYDAGCVLFKGVDARPQKIELKHDGTSYYQDYYWRASYQFETTPCSTYTYVNDTGLLETVVKRGYDVLWEKWVKTSDEIGNIKPKIDTAVLVRVYPEFDFTQLNLPFPA